ncbi:MAG: hypothetical protein VSS75_014250 [Candidatus Parabeggiatoa sp.]|nr:hypothetical protein [Candidatus Parabeggiatoa sp.]
MKIIYVKLLIPLGIILLANPVFAESDLKADAIVDRYQICPKEQITLNGKGSKGDIDEYEWKIETADRVLLYKLEGKTTHLTLDEPGVYSITLTVFGKEGGSDDDSITVTVDECKVIACYHATLIAVHDDGTKLKSAKKEDIRGHLKLANSLAWNLAENWVVNVEVDASCSVNATQYKWKLNGRPKTSGIDATIPLKIKPDGHTITLRVHNDYDSDEASAEFKIDELKVQINLKPDRDTIPVEQILQLFSDTEYGIFKETEIDYLWKTISSDCGDNECFLAGAQKSKAQISDCPISKDMDACTYTIILTVMDPNGVTDQDDKDIKVRLKFKEPIALINVESPSNQDFGTPPLTVRLNGTSSYSPLEISIKEYHWTTVCEFEDDSGNTITRKFPEVKGQYFENTFEKMGDCTITLTVTDDNGVKSESDEVIIRVKPILEFSFDGDKQEREDKKLVYGTNSNIAVGLDVNLAENLKSCPEGMELWGGIYYSESSKDKFLFFTEKTNESHHGLDTHPQAFRTHFSFPYSFKLLETLLPPDIKGRSYIFFAALVSKGKNPVKDINTLCDDPSPSAVNFSCPDFPDLVPNLLICRTINVIE